MPLDLLERIDQRTRLAGHNRLALLLFRLGGRQLFGVNVFKVQEVLRKPRLFPMPHSPAQVLGAADLRGRSVPVIDLAQAVGFPEPDPNPDYLIVTEFNRSVQGFLVSAVDRIVDIDVVNVQPPPGHEGESSHLTAVTRHHGELIQIVDVERVLAEVAGPAGPPALALELPAVAPGCRGRVLVVDDSRVARGQIQRVLEQLGLEAVLLADGRQALEHLQSLAAQGEDVCARYRMVISDIEMPAMDGYSLTTEIRRDPRLAGLYVLLHTSLSGIFNNAMVERVGANCFVAKYSPDELAQRVMARLEALGVQ
ncbi:chemotaxis protein CheV [Vulcaniibacterium thermophilum]|uniref:Chemotaxis protein n=1 Tax=Vulcaniibacterium thermophilum TaxID=1169913 RepID=A0A918Z5U6_9GAMM|nr:chemotaxis protein CheV [Vulcaniibacterium thermophilum]GHE37262.1 chemotaxis protein [Vulcaniibacterium thermophilum]